MPDVEFEVIDKDGYKYTAILNKGNFYSIIFVNAKEDATCSEKYEAFVETLDFISDNS